MNRHIKTCRAEQEYFFREGCHIIEISNSSDDAAVSIARARLETGVTTRWHWLEDTYERYVITRGKGLVELGDEPPAPVSVGDVVLIPPRTRQRIHNTGGEDLEFLAICTPRFRHEIYHDLDDAPLPATHRTAAVR